MKELQEYLERSQLLFLIGVREQNIMTDIMLIGAMRNHFDFVHFTPEYLTDKEHELYTVSDALREHGTNRIESVMDFLIEVGVTPSKIVIGFNLAGLNYDTALQTREFMGYNKICEIISNDADRWVHFYDSLANMALLKKKHPFIDFWQQIIVFQNTHSIINRVRLVTKQKIGGVMITFINTDDVQGKCRIDDEKYNDFTSPHINITLTMTVQNSKLPLLNKINLIMAMANYEIEREKQYTDKDAIVFAE